MARNELTSDIRMEFGVDKKFITGMRGFLMSSKCSPASDIPPFSDQAIDRICQGRTILTDIIPGDSDE